MKLLGKLFGSDKIVDAGISAGDKLFFTNEEKADYKLRLLKAYEPFKLAQRLIALLVVGAFIITHVLAVILYAASSFNADLTLIADNICSMNNEALSMPVSIVIAWYFAGGVLNKFKKK